MLADESGIDQNAHGEFAVRDAPHVNRKVLLAIVAWVVALWLATGIQPVSRRDWLLENLLVGFFAVVLVATHRRFAFSTASYLLLTVFLSLHMVGAHYTYSEVPLGFWVQDALGLSRNHYDRLVHFSFGLLVAYPFREWLMRVAGVNSGWSYAMSVVLILSFSSLYEVMEGLTAIIVSPELGSAFLGTQGDEWDAQKDTALAFVGAVTAMLVVWSVKRGPSPRPGVSPEDRSS
jgi:putative membrane protein